METQSTEQQTAEQQQAVSALYNVAANMLVNEKKSSDEVRIALVQKGLSENAAYTIVSNVEDQISEAKKSGATKDMIYGALWCVGGTIATIANIGFIFWGAILFGGIQFIKGLVNYVGAD